MTTISMLIPVFQTEHLVSNLLDRLTQWNTSECEIIVLFDGKSNQETSLKSRYEGSKIQWLSCENNRGLLSARMELAAAAKGEYLWHVDADDLIAENAFAELVTAATGATTDILEFNAYQQGAESSLKYRADKANSLADRQELTFADIQLGAIIQNVWNKLYRRSAWLERFPAPQVVHDLGRIVLCEDLFVNYLFLRSPTTYQFINTAPYEYCFNAASATNINSVAAIEDRITQIDRCFTYLAEKVVRGEDEHRQLTFQYAANLYYSCIKNRLDISDLSRGLDGRFAALSTETTLKLEGACAMLQGTFEITSQRLKRRSKGGPWLLRNDAAQTPPEPPSRSKPSTWTSRVRRAARSILRKA